MLKGSTIGSRQALLTTKGSMVAISKHNQTRTTGYTTVPGGGPGTHALADEDIDRMMEITGTGHEGIAEFDLTTAGDILNYPSSYDAE